MNKALLKRQLKEYIELRLNNWEEINAFYDAENVEIHASTDTSLTLRVTDDKRYATYIKISISEVHP